MGSGGVVVMGVFTPGVKGEEAERKEEVWGVRRKRWW